VSKRTIATRWVALGALVVALVVAGVVSFYASKDPDGLNRVAIDQGFSDTETEHRTADGPLAGYATSGVEDKRLSGGLSGVVGVVVVLALTAGLAQVVRRRRTEDGSPATTTAGDRQPGR
jgi:cobalt/nickel transport protein